MLSTRYFRSGSNGFFKKEIDYEKTISSMLSENKKVSWKYKTIILILITSCASPPWKKFPMKVKPDVSCYTGSESGSIAYIWECYEGERVVIYQHQAGPYVLSARKQTTACGNLTEIEVLRKFFPSPEGACWKVATPYKSEDRIVSDILKTIDIDKVKGCEFLGEYEAGGDSFEEAEKKLISQMRNSYANSYSELKNIKDDKWYETIYFAKANAYFCPNLK